MFPNSLDTLSHCFSKALSLSQLLTPPDCLIAGNYLQPSRYTIETLTLHFAVDQNMNPDASINNWTLIGVIIRLALRTGLHRDPSHWPNIRPLEAEFRRRLWITLYHMDFFTSTQVGLPRIVKDSQCDVRPPANLIDDDLSFEHDEMPIARPLTEVGVFLDLPTLVSVFPESQNQLPPCTCPYRS